MDSLKISMFAGEHEIPRHLVKAVVDELLDRRIKRRQRHGEKKSYASLLRDELDGNELMYNLYVDGVEAMRGVRVFVSGPGAKELLRKFQE